MLQHVFSSAPFIAVILLILFDGLNPASVDMVTVSRIEMCLVLPSGAGFCPSTVPVGPVF